MVHLLTKSHLSIYLSLIYISMRCIYLCVALLVSWISYRFKKFRKCDTFWLNLSAPTYGVMGYTLFFTRHGPKIQLLCMEAPCADEVHNHSWPSRLSLVPGFQVWFLTPFFFSMISDRTHYMFRFGYVDKLGQIRLSSSWLYVTFICWRKLIVLIRFFIGLFSGTVSSTICDSRLV